MSVTRLQGKTSFSTYVISVFVDGEKLSKIEISGHPHKSVTEVCSMFENTHTKLYGDVIKAIKLAMAKHNEYRGYRND